MVMNHYSASKEVTTNGSFYYSGALDKLASSKIGDGIFNASDSSCSSGYDTDGSTVQEIFENGYDFGLMVAAAASALVWCVKHDDYDNMSFFFVWTYAEVRAKIVRQLGK